MLTRHRDPFQALFDFQRALNARRHSNWMQDATTSSGAYPPINIFRKGDDFVAIVELAGVDKSDLDIQVKDNTLRLSGKKNRKDTEGVSTHRRERVFGTFDRTIQVPVRIDADGVKAEYRDGILALQIPRHEEDKPKKVAIN
ncbi:MAG: Hsp20/alpha crystallin family protein [Hyphomicrobiaceae bacterium]